MTFQPFSLLFFSELINLTPKSEEEWPLLLHAQFTPRGHSLVMVFNYDIYYKTGPKSAQSYRITKTALPSIIYNGVPDWLYEGLFYQQFGQHRHRESSYSNGQTIVPIISWFIAHATMFNDEWIVCMSIDSLHGMNNIVIN